MKKYLLVKQLLILSLLLGGIFAQGQVVCASEVNEAQYFAYRTDDRCIIAGMSYVGGKDCSISIAYYKEDKLIKTNKYHWEQTKGCIIRDKIPWNVNRAIVRFYVKTTRVGMISLRLDTHLPLL